MPQMQWEIEDERLMMMLENSGNGRSYNSNRYNEIREKAKQIKNNNWPIRANSIGFRVVFDK